MGSGRVIEGGELHIGLAHKKLWNSIMCDAALGMSAGYTRIVGVARVIGV